MKKQINHIGDGMSIAKKKNDAKMELRVAT